MRPWPRPSPWRSPTRRPATSAAAASCSSIPAARPSPSCIDYRETAPAAATQDHVRARTTPGTATRPSACPARSAAWPWPISSFGKLPWKDVVDAGRRAGRGGLRHRRQPGRLAQLASSASSSDYPELRRVFGKDGGKADWQAGDRLVQTDLARTLRLIAEQGPDAFYTGAIADQIVAEMKAGGGLITKEDLANYQANARKPIHGTYRGYDVYGPPPPSSGGICLVEMLNILENFDLQEAGPLVARNAAPDDRSDAPRLSATAPATSATRTSPRFPPT